MQKSKSKLEYLAVPYTFAHADARVQAAVQETRFEIVNAVAATLIKEGHLIYSPISHSHPIFQSGVAGGDWETWKKLDLALLAVCKRLLVLRLDGWKESEGVQSEIVEARRLGIRVKYIDLDPGLAYVCPACGKSYSTAAKMAGCCHS